MPQVGDGATILYYSDRQAATVIEVSQSGQTLWLQEDTATRTDSNGMSEMQHYSYAPNPNGRKHKATLRKDGTYRLRGSRDLVHIGHRRQYYDYSF